MHRHRPERQVGWPRAALTPTFSPKDPSPRSICLQNVSQTVARASTLGPTPTRPYRPFGRSPDYHQPVKCFHCGSPDHWRAGCPELGHAPRERPRAKGEADAEAPSTAGGGGGLVWSNQARAAAASERHARTARGGEGDDRDRDRGVGGGEGSSGEGGEGGGGRRALRLMRHAPPMAEAPPPPRHPYTRQEGDTSQVDEAS